MVGHVDGAGADGDGEESGWVGGVEREERAFGGSFDAPVEGGYEGGGRGCSAPCVGSIGLGWGRKREILKVGRGRGKVPDT